MAEQEKIDTESYDDVDTEHITEKYVKPVRLSLHLIVRRNLSKDASGMPQEDIINELNKVTRVRLDRENIGEIDSLELLSSKVTHLYLQWNRLQRIQTLDCLPNIKVLVLSNNSIRDLKGISHLEKLVFLDISANSIDQIDADELPANMVILNLEGNECVNQPMHREKVIKRLKKLKQLNGSDVTVRDKISAGIDVLEEEEESDDDEDDDEDGHDEDNEEEVNSRLQAPPSPPPMEAIPVNDELSGYKQLPKIQASITDLATEILLRSQARMEATVGQHQRHVQEMVNAKIKARLRPLKDGRSHD